MKTLLLIFFIPLLSYSQNEIEFNKENLEEVFRLLNINSESSNSIFCNKSFEYLKVENCNEEQAHILLKEFDRSFDKLKRLQAQISNYISKNTLSSSQQQEINQINTTLKCIENQFLTTELKCAEKEVIKDFCKGSAQAVVLDIPFKLFGIKLYTQTSKQVRICPQYFKDFKTPKPDAIIHEFSHLCGTQDYKYFKKGNPPSSYIFTEVDNKVQRVSSLENADTYAYWSEFGFCMLGQCGSHLDTIP